MEGLLTLSFNMQIMAEAPWICSSKNGLGAGRSSVHMTNFTLPPRRFVVSAMTLVGKARVTIILNVMLVFVSVAQR